MSQGDTEHPPPDHKDWTWVLERPCPECGFRAEAVDRDQIGALLRANAAGFRAALQQGDIVHRRPPVPAGSPPRWSALEYGGHVADVYELARERLMRMLKKKSPTFADWDQDHAAIEGSYAAADPDKVAYRLAVTAGQVADLVDKIRVGQWERTGTRSDGAAFTVESFARFILHDVTHHLWDVERGYRAIREATKAAAAGAAGPVSTDDEEPGG
jgi:hypothetical protein